MNKQTDNLNQSPLYEARYGYKEEARSTAFFLLVMIVLFAAIFFRAYLITHFEGVVVSGNSMRNTLYSGEQLLMKKTDGSDAERGDVIVVYVGDYAEFNDGGDTRYLIKRLIAVEGDRVRCEDGAVEICYAGTDVWETLEEPYAYYVNSADYDFAEYTVGEGEVFFLGDNRNQSQDSRYQEGYSRLDRLYKRSDIVGIVPEWAIEHQSALEKIFFNRIGCFGVNR